MATQQDVLTGADPEQIRLMKERVILLNEQDAVIGSMSKKDSHLISNNLPLHRAFSVFLFDSNGCMLLQKRAAEKVTFPSYWTNTVCSHPLHTPAELGHLHGDDTITGVKRAAVRKLSHELGIKEGCVTLNDLKYLTRIHYRAECDDGVWGEHEIDYVFVVQKDVQLSPEPNEVEHVQYVTREKLNAMFDQADSSTDLCLTPWFQHIMRHFGWDWWHALVEHGMDKVETLRDSETIHHIKHDGTL